MDRFGPAVRRKSGKRTMSVRFPARLMPNLSFSSKVVVYGHRLVALPLTVNETQKCPSLLPIFKQDHSGGDSVAIGVAIGACDLGPRQYLSGDNSDLNKSNKGSC